ncbi:MAG: EAL domain-containing protein [Gammaproteobacteria bacterium]|nr:EAL domain-containing protein [Gammaproteobacteria bacterium]
MFIPLAEQSGHIQSFTWWALKTALYQLGRWQRAGYELGMAVNLSAELLVDDSVPGILGEELTTSQVAAEQLTVEITENSIMADPFRANLILQNIHTLGVRLSVDDFGTGYSSLAYLANLPVDEVKVDRSFVGTMHTNEKNRTIVRSTIDLGHNLGLSVVAEGIENREAWDLLGNLGCDLAQGYFLARPLPAEDVDEFLTKRFNPKAA